MPGCNKVCYVEQGRIHDFCGRTHAKEYEAMVEEYKKQKVRESRIKAVSKGSHGQGVSTYAEVASTSRSRRGFSHTRSGALYNHGTS